MAQPIGTIVGPEDFKTKPAGVILAKLSRPRLPFY
jgi:hypothetical protein